MLQWVMSAVSELRFDITCYISTYSNMKGSECFPNVARMFLDKIMNIDRTVMNVYTDGSRCKLRTNVALG